MLKLFLVTTVFGGCLLLSLRQLCRGLLLGRVVGLAGSGKGGDGGGDKEGYFVEVSSNDRPYAFWGFMLQQVIFSILLSYAVRVGVFQKYLFAEIRPTIAYVQPNGQDSLLIYWSRPDRIDDPVEYIIYRGRDANTLAEVARQEGDASDGQIVDSDVALGVEYTYQVEARYSPFTQWLLSGKSTRSDPVSATWSQ